MNSITGLLLAVLLIASQGVWGAEVEDTEATADSSPPNGESQGTEGVFLPSEEISEDFAVSFPVDI